MIRKQGRCPSIKAFSEISVIPIEGSEAERIIHHYGRGFSTSLLFLLTIPVRPRWSRIWIWWTFFVTITHILLNPPNIFAGISTLIMS
jgi:hypothetical protein